MERMDPFLAAHYSSAYECPVSKTLKRVVVEPDRGFETVTMVYQGKVEHHDSAGGGGVIGEGDVQWMTAAGGILQKEFHKTEWSKTGGLFQIVQLWVNLPSKHKNSVPKYQAIAQEKMTKVDLGTNGFIELIAGDYQGKKGPADTFTPVTMLNAKLKEGGKADFTYPGNYTTFGLVIEGNIKING